MRSGALDVDVADTLKGMPHIVDVRCADDPSPSVRDFDYMASRRAGLDYRLSDPSP